MTKRRKPWTQRDTIALRKHIPYPISINYIGLAESQPTKYIDNPEFSRFKSLVNKLKGVSDWDVGNEPMIGVPDGPAYPVLRVGLERRGSRGSKCQAYHEVDVGLMELWPDRVAYVAKDLLPSIEALNSLIAGKNTP